MRSALASAVCVGLLVFFLGHSNHGFGQPGEVSPNPATRVRLDVHGEWYAVSRVDGVWVYTRLGVSPGVLTVPNGAMIAFEAAGGSPTPRLAHVFKKCNEFLRTDLAAVNKVASVRVADFDCSTWLNDEGLTVLAEVATLTTVALGCDPDCCLWTEAGLNALLKNDELRSLAITNFRDRYAVLSIGALQSINGASRLLHLSLRGVRGVSGHLSLGGLQCLQALRISNAGANDRDVAGLDKLVSLRRLDLGGNRITPAVLPSIGSLQKLTALDLRGMKFTDDAQLVHLRRLTELTALSLEDTGIHSSALTFLRDLQQIEQLYLSGCPEVGDDFMEAAGPMPELRELHLNSTRVTDGGLPRSDRWPMLMDLRVADTNVTDAGIAKLGTRPELQNLDVGGTRVTGAFATPVAVALPNLRNLVLDGCSIDRQVVGSLANAPSLVRVSLAGAQVAGEVVAELRKAKGRFVVAPDLRRPKQLRWNGSPRNVDERLTLFETPERSR